MGRSPLQRALEDYLQKWYPETLKQDSEMLEKDKFDDTVTEISAVSVEAIKVDVDRFLRLVAAEELREQVRELKDGVCNGRSGRQDSEGTSAEEGKLEE